MASWPVLKNAALGFPVFVRSQADSTIFQINPTVAAGDFKIHIGNAAATALTTTPSVVVSTQAAVWVTLTAGETNADVISIVAHDAAGAEWFDGQWTFFTSSQQMADVALATALATLSGVVALSTQVDALEGNVAHATAITSLAAQVSAIATNLTSGVVASNTVAASVGAVSVSAITVGVTVTAVATGGMATATLGAVSVSAITAAVTVTTVGASVVADIQSGLALSTQVDALEAAVATQVAQATALATLSGVVALSTQVDALEAAIATTVAQATMLATSVVAVASILAAPMIAIVTSTAAATAFNRAISGLIYGTVGSGSTTTAVVLSAISVTVSNTGQFQGRIMTFASDTTTASLRGCATDITSHTTGSTPTITCTALPVAPASGDTFAIS